MADLTMKEYMDNYKGHLVDLMKSDFSPSSVTQTITGYDKDYPDYAFDLIVKCRLKTYGEKEDE